MRSQFDDDGNRPDVADVVAQVSETLRRNIRRFLPIAVGLVLAGLLY